MVKDSISFHRELLSNKFQLVYNALLGFLGFYIYCADEEGSKCNVVKNLEEQNSVIFIVNGHRTDTKFNALLLFNLLVK